VAQIFEATLKTLWSHTGEKSRSNEISFSGTFNQSISFFMRNLRRRCRGAKMTE
jgi:hypothetical protein